MNPASKYAFPDRDAGGYAPQSSPPFPHLAPEGFFARAAAHRSSLFVALGVGIAIAVSVNAIVPVASRVLQFGGEPPISRLLPAYSGIAGSEVVVCGVNSGVCSMRIEKDEGGLRLLGERFAPAAAGLARRIAETPIEPITAKKITLEDLTEPEMLAMMQMSRMTREQAIWFKLKQTYSVPPFTRSTFAMLREKGLARIPEGKVYHALTWDGDCLAHDVADHLQKKHKVHQAYLLGRVRATVTLKCTCNWGCGIRAGDNMQAKADRAFSKHLLKMAEQPKHETALAPVCQGIGDDINI